MRAVLCRPRTGGRGRYPGQGVADQATVGGAAEGVRPVAGLDVDHRAASGGLSPGDEVTGGRVLPRRARRSRRAQHLPVCLPERAVRRVRADQGEDVGFENGAAVQLVAQLEVVEAGTHGVVPIHHSRGVLRVPEARIGPGLTAKLGGGVVVAAAEHLGPPWPRGPAGQRVVQEHEALPRGEQLRQPPGHLGCRRDRLRGAPAPQGETRQVMAQEGVEHPAVFRAKPLLGGGLDGAGEGPATFGADVAEHAGERILIDAVTSGDGQKAHRPAGAHQAPASRARRKKSAPATVYPPST